MQGTETIAPAARATLPRAGIPQETLWATMDAAASADVPRATAYGDFVKGSSLREASCP